MRVRGLFVSLQGAHGAEPFQHARFAERVAELLEGSQRPLETHHRLVVVALQLVQRAEPAQRPRLAAAVAQLAQRHQGLLQVGQSVHEPACLDVGGADARGGQSLTMVITSGAEGHPGLLEVGKGIIEPVLQQVEFAQTAQRSAFASGQARVPGSSEHELADESPVIVVPAHHEEASESLPEGTGKPVQSCRTGLLHGTDQDRPLDLEPDERVDGYCLCYRGLRAPAGHRVEGDAECRTRRALPSILGEGEPASDRPLKRREPLGFRLLGGHHLSCIGAEQVVEAVAELSRGIVAGHVDQLCIDQGVHQGIGWRLRNIEQRGDHPGREVGCVEQPEAPKGALSGLVKAVVTQRERGPYLQVSESELVEATVFVG